MHNFARMCGGVYVKSTIADMVQRFSFANPAGIHALDNAFPLYNGAPLGKPALAAGHSYLRGRGLTIS